MITLSDCRDSKAMNNSSCIFLIRCDHAVGLACHLAAGILALVLLTGATSSKGRSVLGAKMTSSAVAQR
jgi:hypothetical protein